MRKTHAAIMAVVLALGCAANAQAEFRIGPRLGMNINKLSFDKNILDGSNRLGFSGGVQAEYWLPIVGLGVDLSVMYTYMDSKVNFANGDQNTEAVFDKLRSKPARNFIEIPLNIKYRFGIGAISRIFAPYVFTGPGVAIRLDGSDYNASTQWVWNLGFGFEFIRHLQLSASYGFGMNNIVDGKKLDIPVIGTTTLHSDQIKVKNNYWTVTAAWMF